MSTADILSQVKSLPVSERLAVAEAIWDDIEDSAFEETPEFRAELRRRLEDAKKNPDTVSSWDDVRIEARRLAAE
jgi:putative addiction module component (TIGR02574 family)